MLTHKGIAFIVLLTSLLVPCLAWGQSTGKISGRVLDSQTGEPLPGANVLIKGTAIGASTNLDGRYTIENAPAGADTLRVSYIGYTTREVAVQVREGASIALDLELQAVGVKGKEVVVTAQASGQNAAINQQLASQNVVNVVSAARIKELPDANAAESVGRLPGVFLMRSYGEGSQVSIRGLAPQYNQVLVDGIQIPATDANNRSVDMSMISSDMLSGIELFKTVTPDMDANVLGGTVNFQIREARAASSGAPRVDLVMQGGYNNLQSTYNDYKVSATVEKRFADNAFGVLVQGIVERKNLTADIFGGDYGQQISSYTDFGSIVMNSLNLQNKPTEKQRYDGTFVLDYKWNGGKADLMNMVSKGSQSTETFRQSFNMNSNNNSITYLASQFTPVTNVITNILDVRQNVLSFNVDARLSHAYTENINPGYWSLTFTQGSAGVSGVDQSQNPVAIARDAAEYVNPDRTWLSGISTNSNFTRQRNVAGSVDFERSFNVSDFISADLKFGGTYRYTFRSNDHSTGDGANLDNPAEGAGAVRAAIIAANPWMVQWLSSHGLQTNGNSPFPITMFYDSSSAFGEFLGGDYTMTGYPTDIGLLSRVQNEIILSQVGHTASTGNYYAPDEKGNISDDYHGTEYQNAGYIMAAINLGPQVTLIPGVRYQGLRTTYTAAYISLWGSVNTYPNPFPHIDTTVSEYHGYWLPDIILRYRPFSWFDVRLSYTNTLSYPDFRYLTPQIHINSSITPGNVDRWNNFDLKPARSQNYDLALSFYDNTIGLFSVDPFLKRIDDFIFTYGGYAITDPSIYPLPAYTLNYTLSNTQINNPYRVDLWGVEVDWQTHFWYLPSVLSGLVMNANYTHIFSQAKYPIHFTRAVGFPPKTVQVDTFYTARLIDQPSNIINLSVGYDYLGFSARLSMINQFDVFNGTNFWPGLRQAKATYLRWDFSAKQNLPWLGLQVYLDILNLNGEPDETVIQASGFPTAEESYGLTADLGIRWSL